RFSRDWSSDVCSSDLVLLLEGKAQHLEDPQRIAFLAGKQPPSLRIEGQPLEALVAIHADAQRQLRKAVGMQLPGVIGDAHPDQRSEERRVGEECRSEM